MTSDDDLTEREKEAFHEEQRRLFYVGLTRTREVLVLSSCPVGLVCYIPPNRDQCYGQGWFWNGQPTTIDPNSSTMLMLTKRQANDLTHLYDSLPAERNGSALDWFLRYWLPADQPNWPQ